MRKETALLAVLGLLSVASVGQAPNIVLVMTDDQGYGDMGVHGNPDIDTPRLDRFATESLGMDRFYVNPLCSPTRASLMTGRYHLRTGILHTSRGAAKMWDDEVTIAEALKGAGYRTGIFGKWHLGDNYPMRPQDQGFEEVYIHQSGGIGQTPDTDANYFEPVVWRNGARIKEKGYCTDLFFDEAIAFLERKREAPFFIYIAPNVPHTPLEVSDAYSAPFLKAGLDEKVSKIYGMLKNLDENFGRLLDAIDSQGIRQETLVIFMTDNGPTSGRYNEGMRGNKASVYEGGIRVPFYARWPGEIEGGRRVDLIAAHIDVMPTLMEIAGTKGPQDRVIDGMSLLPLWKSERSSGDWPTRTLFTQHIKSIAQAPYQNATGFDQRYKFVSYPKTANAAHFQPNYENLEIALYDLQEDPSEQRNIASEKPERLQSLRQSYEAWFREMEATRGFRPGLIELGTPYENPSLLCRYQDGHRVYGTDAEPLGWPIRIGETARFRIDASASGNRAGNLVIDWMGKRRAVRLASGQRTAEFVLEAGDGMLDVWIESLSGESGPKDFDVMVERL